MKIELRLGDANVVEVRVAKDASHFSSDVVVGEFCVDGGVVVYIGGLGEFAAEKAAEFSEVDAEGIE